MGAIIDTLAFPAPPKEWGREELLRRPDLVWLETVEKERIPAVHVRSAKPGTPSGITILYSHGNAEDVGICLPYLDQVCHVTGADMLAYEYVGYGESSGKPSEKGCYQSIDAGYDYLVRKTNLDPRSIVAFGRSLGSGPTVDLVSRTPGIRGMVLQSPLESGARCISGRGLSFIGYYMDIFKSYEKIEKIECPILIMHGTADEVVPCENGRNLYKQCKNPVEPLWVEGRGHNNMPEEECIRKVRDFLARLP